MGACCRFMMVIRVESWRFALTISLERRGHMKPRLPPDERYLTSATCESNMAPTDFNVCHTAMDLPQLTALESSGAAHRGVLKRAVERTADPRKPPPKLLSRVD